MVLANIDLTYNTSIHPMSFNPKQLITCLLDVIRGHRPVSTKSGGSLLLQSTGKTQPEGFEYLLFSGVIFLRSR